MRLREWCADRILRGSLAPAPRVGTGAWQLFLAQERCAALLQESLRRDPPGEPLPQDARDVLSERAMFEMLGILSARGQLRTLAAIAEEEGWRMVALKGTADVAAGLHVPVADVDVWVEPGIETRLASRLDEAGFTPHNADGHFHLAPRTMPGAVQVEIHRAVTGFPDPADLPIGSAVPIPGLHPLLRLAPEDHAWTVLCQAVEKHPDRRSRLRDLLILHEALAACAPAGLARLESRIGASREPELLRRMLDDASGRGTTAANERLYLFLARAGHLSGGTLRDALLARSRNVAACGPGAEWRRIGRLHEYEGRRPAWRSAGSAALHAAACVLTSVVTADLPLLRHSRADRR